MLNLAKFKGSGLPLSYHDVLPNGSRFVRSICMASPSPREKWRYLLSLLRRAAVLCAAATDLVPCSPPHAMFPPTATPRLERSDAVEFLREGSRVTAFWDVQKEHPLPRAP